MKITDVLTLAGAAVAVIGMIYALVLVMGKKSGKKGWLTLALGVIIMAISLLVNSFVTQADYSVANTSEGTALVKKLNDGEDFGGKALKFKVDKISGKSASITFTAPGKFDVVLTADVDARKIKVGDEVTVSLEEVNKVAGTWTFQADYGKD